MNVFITGISGFIGSALAKFLSQRGHNVTGSVSSCDKLPFASQYAVQCFVIRLNEEFDAQVLKGVEAVVHCAYDLRRGTSSSNVEGTKKLAGAATAAGVKSQIFIGSYSAHEQATSEYGQSKLELEKFFLELDQMVAKPGLVVGNGGLFLKMSGFLGKYPCVPLIGGGKGNLPIISIQDLTTALAQLIEKPRAGSFRLWNADQVSLKELLVAIKRAGTSRAVLIPVPVSMVYAALWLSRMLGLKLEVDEGNLKGFQANQSVQAATDLNDFVSQPMTLTEMVSGAFSDSSKRSSVTTAV